MLQRIKTSVLLALIVSLVSCAPSARNASEEATVPADFSIVCGQGGGFTGQWEGHTLRADGTVLAWKGIGAEQNPEPAGVLTAEQKQALWKKIEAIHFFELKEQQRGNMTSYIKVTANSRVHEVYWVPQFGDSASPLQELYVLCQETVSHSVGPPK